MAPRRCFDYFTMDELSTFYLMVIAFSPCIVAEIVSYSPALLLIVVHRPMLLGLAGFSVEVARHVVCSWLFQEDSTARVMRAQAPDYTRIRQLEVARRDGEVMVDDPHHRNY